MLKIKEKKLLDIPCSIQDLNIFFNKKNISKLNFFSLFFILISTSLVCACTSDNKPIKTKSQVENPISFTVKGIDKEDVLQNVNANLASLPKIERLRAPLYKREIELKIQDALHSFGYYHPKISLEIPKYERGKILSIIKDDANLVATVDPGKPLYIRNADIKVIGQGKDYAVFKKIIEDSGLESYDILNHGNYEKLKEKLREKSLELGFFDSKILISRILVYQEQNVADLVFIFDTGIRYKFGQIIASDDTKELMKPSNSLVTFKEDEYFSTKKIQDYTKALSQTNFYRSVDVSPSMNDIKDDKVPINVTLEKQANNLMRVGVGYSTDERARGILGWDKPLINSKGHSFSSYLRVSQVKQDAQAIYKIPRKNPNLDYFYIKLSQTHTDFNDTLSDLSHMSFHYVANMTGKWRRDYYLAGEYEDYTQGVEYGYTKNLMLGFLISRRTTTGEINPRFGYSISFDNKFGSRAITDYNFWISEFIFKGVVAPSLNTRLFYKFYQGGVIGSDSYKVPPSMRFFAGGEQTLRGFSYKSQSPRDYTDSLKGGRYLTASSLELSFPLWFDKESSRGVIFLDGAICTDDYSSQKIPLYSPGIGYRYISEYGIAKIDLAYGVNNQRKEKGFKLHLSFGPEF